MPTQIFETKQRRTLLATVEKHFLLNNWSVQRLPLHERIDFRLTKGNLRSSVKCFDGTDLGYRSVIETLELMESDASIVFSLESRHIIWISSCNPFPFSFEQLVARNVVLLCTDELSILDELATFDKDILTRLDARRIAILKTSHKACVQIAQWMEESKQAQLAIYWYKNAIASISGFSTARRQLFNFLLRQGRKAEAYEVGTEIFMLKPDVEKLASTMESLAVELGFVEDIPKWKHLVSAETRATYQPQDFESLLKKMQKRNETGI